MCIDDGEGVREGDGEVGVVAQRVEVESWDLSSLQMDVDHVEDGRVDGCGDEHEGVWSEYLVVLDCP